jgi:type I restriction enzyme, S subunit
MKEKELPKGWEWKRLGEIGDITMGQSPPGETYNDMRVGLPLLNGPAEFGKDHPTPIQWTSKPTKKSQANDILFCVRGATAGRMNKSNQVYCLGRGLAAIHGKQNKALTAFLFYYLSKSYSFFQNTGRGSTFINISQADLSNLVLPTPPLSIQHQIVAVLEQAEALKRQRKEADALTGALLQSVFYEMFGDPVKNEKGWKITTFGKCCKSIRYGTGMPPEYRDIGVPFIRATNVKNGGISEKNLMYVSVEDAKKIEKCRIHEGNIIIVRSGVNTGDCAYVPKKYDGALAGYDLIVEFESSESAQFLNFLLCRKPQ